MRIDELTSRLEDRLRAVGSPERAEAERRYLKSDLAFLGVSVWQIRSAVKETGGEIPDLDHYRLIALAGGLWPEPVFERRMAAVFRKAIGWVLREASKKRPDEVAAWVAPRTHRVSGVTMREAVKYLYGPNAQRLMAAYHEKAPATEG